MKLLALNPNSNPGMTASVAASVQARVPRHWEVIGWTACEGPPVIKDGPSYEIASRAMPALAAAVPRADGILLACFGDPGLGELRARAGVPVAGLAEAAILHARQLGEPFAILTAGAGWVPILSACVAAGGATDLFAGVLALDGDGAALAADPDRFRAQVLTLSRRARQQGARRIILGGAAFEGLQFEIAEGLAVDRPVEIATTLLVRDMDRAGRPSS